MRMTQNCNTKVYAGSLFRFLLSATGLVRARSLLFRKVGDVIPSRAKGFENGNTHVAVGKRMLEESLKDIKPPWIKTQ